MTGNIEQGDFREEITLSCVAVFGFAATTAPETIIVDAVRCWRDAIDRKSPVLPTLFARLETNGAGFLAPAIAALLAVHEAWSGQRFQAGDRAASALTEDEMKLLGLLETTAPPPTAIPLRPGLTAPLRIALRSTRILLLRVLGRDLGDGGPASPAATNIPMFFAFSDEAPAMPDPHGVRQTQDAA
ncbi:hypothetical protein [Edaphosphingomonas haloaromaticamans]|uniref:hypothetical protein n=1 Tax=Edaphosphingomonas haloaromaticamans TaxID=653954 RepID=UPI0008A9DCA6|nr:hypothetical protein [Sphingomonas haloaromaticamans]